MVGGALANNLIIRIAGLTDATQAAIITAVMKGNDL
jgi:hypothetical protein